METAKPLPQNEESPGDLFREVALADILVLADLIRLATKEVDILI